MSYCLNPKCPNPADPANENQSRCCHCGCDLLLLGRYRITRPLGGGGFGKTFEVDDRGAPKVLKVLLQNHEKAVELFQQEADVLKRVKHPGIPKIDSDGYFIWVPTEGAEPLHCLVMEKISGLNLREWLKKRNNRPLSEAQAVDWLKQLSEILAQVHKENFFHRDIKPLNIMIKPNGQLVLIDFGAAREVTATYFAKVGQGQNITGIVSPGYTPAEQANGKAVPQSDFYALGRTFVYLLTGLPPTSFSEHPRTGKLVWRNKAPHVSRGLADVIDYMMAPFPGKRPQNCQAILQCLAELEVTEAPSGSPTQSSQNTNLGGRGSYQTKTNYTGLARLSSSGGTRLTGLSSTVSSSQRSSRGSSTKTANSKKKLRLVGAIVLLALAGSQLYGFWRYGLFPANPIGLITSLPSSVFLQRSLRGGGDVKAIAISPVRGAARQIGATLVSGSFGTIRGWNLSTGKLLYTIDAHKSWINSLAISPDGRILASGSDDKTIRLWNLQTGSRMLTIPTGAAVKAIALSPDGYFLASAGDDKTIRIWELRTGSRLRTIVGHTGAVNAIAISPDSQTLASGSDDKTIKIWDLNTGGRLRTLTGHSKGVLSLAYSPDGQTLASGSNDKTIGVWNLKTGKLKYRLTGDSSLVRSVVISPDGRTLASGGGTIQIWDLATGKLRSTLEGHSSYVSAIALSSDGQTLLSGSPDWTVKIWRVPPPIPPKKR